MKIGLIGCGYLGNIHAKCLKEVENVELIGVFDISAEKCEETAQKFATKYYDNLDKLIADCDALDIVSATNSHFEIAKKVILAGKHCFIEKPVTATIMQAEELIELAQNQNIKIQIGHIERYNPAFIAAQKLIENPLFIETVREGKFSPRGSDVSVVHDLMIHDIDLVLSIAKSRVSKIEAIGCKLVTNSIDKASVHITFENGVRAHLVASRIAAEGNRKLCIIQEKNNIIVNFQEKRVHTFSIVENETKITEVETVASNALIDELTDFIGSINNNNNPKVTLFDGYCALVVVEDIIRKITT